MQTAILAGIGAAGLFVLLLWLGGLLADRGAAAMSIIAVAILYPAFALEAGISEFVLHLAILGCFLAGAVTGYLFAPRLIALVVLAHALFDLAFVITVGAATPWWVGFCGGFDILLGAVFLRTLAARA